MSTTPTEILQTTAAAIETTIAATEAAIAETTAATEAVLDIASIKSLMDGFDPAALLPDLSRIFGSLSAVCRFAVMVGPVVILLLGLSYLFFAPKEANYYLGYRCYYGMGSVYAWRFTQRLAGMLFTGAGVILTVVMFILTAPFSAMTVTDMVWKAFSCLILQAGVTLVMVLSINLSAAFRFNRKGEHRRKKRK